MKLKLFYLLVLLIVCTSVSAQKNVNVDNLRFSYNRRYMPQRPQNPLFFYYGVNFKIPATISNYIDTEELYDKVYLSGQRFTDSPTNNDMIFQIEFQPVYIVSTEVKERYVEKKGDKGPERTYYFWLEVVYTFKSDCSIYKGGSYQAGYTIFNRNTTFTYKSSEYGRRKTANDFWRNNKDVLMEQFTRECAIKSTQNIFYTLTSHFGFPIRSTSTLIKTINEKKHPENDALRAASNRLKLIMESLNGLEAPTEADMGTLIKYFEEIPRRYTYPKLKADIRLRYVAYYNLCRIYMFLDQPQKVKKYADLLYQNGHDTKDRDRLIKDASELQTYLNNAYIKASQFTTDPYFEN